MKLDLAKISIDNFKGVTGDTLIFDLEDHGVGLHFIRGRNNHEPRLGSNGAGKSTLWDACSWCLYGKTPDGLRNPDIKPWESDKNRSVVQVQFLIDDELHWVSRSASPNILMVDGKEAGQEQVDRLIGMSFDTFTSTVLLGQGRPLFFDLSPKDKMDLFSTILDLDRWEMRSKRASKQYTELTTDIAVNETEITRTNTELKAIMINLAELKQQAEEWSTNSINRLDQIEKEIKQQRKRIAALQPERDNADLALESAAMELRPIQQQISRFITDLRQVEKNYIEFDARITQAKQQRAILIEGLRELDRSKNCPTCGQPIKKGDVAKHRRDMQGRLKGFEQVIKDGIPPRTVELKQSYGKQIDNLTKLWQEWKEAADKAQTTLNRVTPDIVEAQTKIRSLEASLSDRREEENPYAAQLQKVRKDRVRLKAALEALAKEGRILNRKRERTFFWVKAFKDVRLSVIDEVLTELELATTNLLDEVGLVGWGVRYDVEKETKSGTIQRGMNVMILSPNNEGPVKWESWSGGERQRLRILGALALSDTLLNRAGIQVGFEILDEPTQFLSAQGVDDLVECLAHRAAELGRSIWLTDHHAIESSSFASVLTVIRDREGHIKLGRKQ